MGAFRLRTANLQLDNRFESSSSFTLLDISVLRSVVRKESCMFESKYTCEFKPASTFLLKDNSRTVV